ncbi:FHA domain-containing protein [Curtobacterium sp. MCBD17_032]|uniref:FHA domain-containing protein n=1 Tax=Curtobacterium sp. MCBD17_032 TaxID=2175659 RepID=UPI001C6489B4|nr:FHA domain-containing protein [Curtobacterium sp. MCBD17_032]
MQQPGEPGHGVDTAADAWLPESTLDPATRAWLTGADRVSSPTAQTPPEHHQDGSTGVDRSAEADQPRPGDRRTGLADTSSGTEDTSGDDLAPRSAPSHVHRSGSGLGDWTGRSTADEPPVEPTLDPDAFPAETLAPQDDPEVQRADAWDERAVADQDDPTPHASTGVESTWAPQSTPTAPPSGPSWWIGRAPSTEATSAPAALEQTDGDDPQLQRADDAPRPGDTAVFRLPPERRAPRPAPLVPPGSQSTACHVCGHTLEPDDIFCEECGSVRPAVTAAFTGPVMPLPLTRPDWAADEDALRSAVSDAHDLTEESDGLPDTASAGSGEGSDDAGSSGDGATAHDDATVRDRGDDADVVVDGLDPRGVDGPPARTTVPDDDDARQGAAVDDPADAPELGVDPATGDADGPGTAEAAPDDTADDSRADTVAEQADEPARGPSMGPSTGPTGESRAGTSAQLSPVAAPLPPVAAPLPPVAAPLPPVAPPRSGDGAPAAVATPAAEHTGPVGEDAGGASPDADVEATRIVSRAPAQVPFLLHFSTGERLGVHGSALLGRLPRPEADEQFDGLLTIRDPGKSVSKTHLELGRDGDDLWVSDRFSGNGTIIRHIDGSIRRCEPGRRYRVERGARVDIGEQFFLVQ